MRLQVLHTDWDCRKSSDHAIDVYYKGKAVGRYSLLQQPYCEFCACPQLTTNECTSRRNHSYDGFDKICAMGIYYKTALQKPDLLSQHIIELKQDIEFAKPLIQALSLLVKDRYPELLKSDLLVPVASHPSEIEERGFNQAFALAEELSYYLGIVVYDALSKTRNDKMPKRGWLERRQAAQGLYVVKQPSLQLVGKHILLVDDVVTSGATASECALVLKSNGALSVRVITAGRTVYTKVET